MKARYPKRRKLWISFDPQGTARGIFHQKRLAIEDASTFADADYPWMVVGPYELGAIHSVTGPHCREQERRRVTPRDPKRSP